MLLINQEQWPGVSDSQVLIPVLSLIKTPFWSVKQGRKSRNMFPKSALWGTKICKPVVTCLENVLGLNNVENGFSMHDFRVINNL